MKLFISDIHGNVENLKKLNLNKYDTIFFLGDLYSSITGEPSVKEFLTNNKSKLICVKGNCDFPNDYIDLGLICNENIYFNEDNISFYCTHGNKILQNNNDVIIYGHEHRPYIKKVDNQIYICVGSVSRPRDSKGPSYLEYDNNNFILKNFDGEIIEQIKISNN